MKKQIFFILAIAILISLNMALIWPLFLGEYDRNVASIGIAHILNARYLSRFWHYGWNPFWYGGFVNHLIYPLLAPISLALIQKLSFGVLSMPQIYRIVVASAYVLMSITLFFLVRYFTKRNLAGFLAGLIYTLAPSANYFLVPTLINFARHLHWAPWRLSVIVDFGEGPHMIALSLVPLAVISYWKLLKEKKFYQLILTGFLISIIISINLFSAYALAYFLLGVFISEILLGEGGKKFKISLMLAPLIYGLVAYCYDPSMLQSLAASGYVHPENVFRLPPLTNLFLFAVIGLAPVLFIFYEIFKKKPKLQLGLTVGFWFLIFWLIPYLFYRGIWFGSQPNRYMPELNMVVAMILAIVITWVYDQIRKKMAKPGKALAIFWLIICLVGLSFASQDFIKHGWELSQAHPDFKETTEYKIAHWAQENVSYEKGERVYLSGSPAFFFNEFADVPQLRGDEDNAQANHWWADVVYQVNTGEDGELAVGWLQAYNMAYAVVDFGASTPYRDFKNTDKFKDLTKTVKVVDGFEILKIPGEKNMIQAVDLEKTDQLKPFEHSIKPVLDKDGLMAYLEAIKTPLGVELEYEYFYRTNPDLAVVKVANAKKSTGILFKTTFNSGWRAKLNSGQKVVIVPIGPDLMLAKPGVEGNYTLAFSYHRPLVEYLGYLATLITIVSVVWLVKKKGNFKL